MQMVEGASAEGKAMGPQADFFPKGIRGRVEEVYSLRLRGPEHVCRSPGGVDSGLTFCYRYPVIERGIQCS